MKDVKITVMRKVSHDDLIERYENPIEHACDLNEGDIYISKDGLIPKGFCESAWSNLYPYVFALSCGARDFFDGWMKNENTAMVSCNDGFRPVSFLLEALEDS